MTSVPPAPAAPPAAIASPAARRFDRRRWLWRAFLLGWIALTAHLVWVRYGVEWRLRAMILSRQGACLRHVDPPDRVMLDGAVEHNAMQTAPAGYRFPYFRHMGGASMDGSSTSVPANALLATEGEERWRRLDRARDALDQFVRLRRPPGPAAGGGGGGGLFVSASGFLGPLRTPDASTVVLTHARRAPGGPERLVVVWAGWDAHDNAVGFAGVVHSKATILRDAAELSTADAMRPRRNALAEPEFLLFRPPPGGRVRVFAGQPDPADAARFTADVELSAGRATVEGTLRPDDTVAWRVLNEPPAAPVAAPAP